MAGVNKVILIGNLGADPELKTLSGGSVTCRLSVATSRSWKNKNTDELETETVLTTHDFFLSFIVIC